MSSSPEADTIARPPRWSKLAESKSQLASIFWWSKLAESKTCWLLFFGGPSQQKAKPVGFYFLVVQVSRKQNLLASIFWWSKSAESKTCWLLFFGGPS